MYQTLFTREQAISIIEDSFDVAIDSINGDVIVLKHVPFDLELPIYFVGKRPTIRVDDFGALFAKAMGGHAKPLFDEQRKWLYISHESSD